MGLIMNFKLKNYFLHNVLTPQMYLEDIYLNNNHPEHQNLKEDLDILEEEDVLKYYKKHETQINFLNKKIPDVMVYSRILLLGELIADSIFEDRLNALLNNKPYDLKEFNDTCDDEFLIDVKKSNIKFSDSIIINNNKIMTASTMIKQELKATMKDILGENRVKKIKNILK